MSELTEEIREQLDFCKKMDDRVVGNVAVRYIENVLTDTERVEIK